MLGTIAAKSILNDEEVHDLRYSGRHGVSQSVGAENFS